MKSPIIRIVLMITLLTSVPAFAGSVSANGVTREQIAEILVKHGLPAKTDKSPEGNLIITSRVSGINFDVYFYNCGDSGCTSIQFAAGWSNNKTTPARVNEWNTRKRFLRVYWKPGNILFAEQDIIVTRGTTENIDDCLDQWVEMMDEFKKFMNL